MHRLVTIAALALAACGTPLDTPDGGPPATPADGGGVCCPLTASEGCASVGFFGGWAQNGSQCVSSSSFDGAPERVFVDDHGCRILRPDTTQPFCGQARLDAGADGSNDAADDAPADAPDDAPSTDAATE
jgi:hypothetical protein